jgi:hypothetical protein
MNFLTCFYNMMGGVTHCLLVDVHPANCLASARHINVLSALITTWSAKTVVSNNTVISHCIT